MADLAAQKRGGEKKKKNLGPRLRPLAAAFWPINCILHHNPSQNQTAVHHRQNGMMGKKATFPRGHGSCFPPRASERASERERERERERDYLRTASPPRDNKSIAIDQEKEEKRFSENVKSFRTSCSCFSPFLVSVQISFTNLELWISHPPNKSWHVTKYIYTHPVYF